MDGSVPEYVNSPPPLLSLGMLQKVSSLLVAAALAAATSACSSGVTDGSPSRSETRSTESAVVTEDAPYGRRMVQWIQTREREVSRCMAERGFDYVPFVAQNIVNDLLAQDETASLEVASPGLDDLVLPLPSEPLSERMVDQIIEDAALNGFHVFIFPELQEPAAAERPSANPNIDIVNSLTDAERTEYFRALQGYATKDVSEDGLVVGGSLDAPCLDVGLEAAGPEPQQPSHLSGIDTQRLFDLGERVYRLALADPEMAVADQELAECLTDNGAPADPAQYMRTMLAQALEQATGSPDGPLVVSGRGPAADLALTFGDEKLAEYQVAERAMAVAYHTCLKARTATVRELLLQYQNEALHAEPDIAAMLGIDVSD